MIISYSDKNPIINEKLPSIFLAGPTPRDKNVKSWRPEAIKILENLKFEGIVYIPECEDEKPLKSYDGQVDWETVCLENSSCIVFHIPRKLPEMPAFTTNVEFGIWITKAPEKVLLCSPIEAEKNRYLEYHYKKNKNEEAYTELSDVLLRAISLSKENIKRKE